MADSPPWLGSPRANSSSPPPNCAICLGSCTDKSFSDSCMHQFCFNCLLQWSKIKAECPLCKQPFKTIIHNVKSIEEYDEHVVETTRNDDVRFIDNELLYLEHILPQRHQFHFRTTFTVDTRGEHAIQQMLLSHPLNIGQITIGSGHHPPRTVYNRRRRDCSSTQFRRSIYSNNMWVSALPDSTGRFRECSPQFYRNNPAARQRLVPWLNRELNALLFENTQLVMRLVDIILELLMRHHVCSRSFRNTLAQYLDSKTEHFIHEFYNFMRSPYDMIGFDNNIVYTEGPRTPAPVLSTSDDSEDSDVILVSADPVVIDLACSDTDSDEPILVTPSGVDGDGGDVPVVVPLPMQEPPVPATLPPPPSTNSSAGFSGTTTSDHRPVSDTGLQQVNLPPKLRHKQKSRLRHHETVPVPPPQLQLQPVAEKGRRKRRKELATSRSRLRYRSRSRSSTSVISSSSSDNEIITKTSYRRYKRKVMKKLKRTEEHPRIIFSDSETEEPQAVSSSSDEDKPLIERKWSSKEKAGRKRKKSRNGQARDASLELERLPKLEPVVQLPSCSRYSSDTPSVEEPIAVPSSSNTNTSYTSCNVPGCSKNNREDANNSSQCIPNTSDYRSYHANQSDREITDGYNLHHTVKSEIREVNYDRTRKEPQRAPKNLVLRKQNNKWYSCVGNSDSSD